MNNSYDKKPRKVQRGANKQEDKKVEFEHVELSGKRKDNNSFIPKRFIRKTYRQFEGGEYRTVRI